MIKAVLFDLDDTLLDINLSAFMARYLSGRCRLLAYATQTPLPKVVWAQGRSYLDVDRGDRQDALTNEQFMAARMAELCGIPLGEPALADALSFFDAIYIERLRGGLVQARPRAGARRTIEIAQSLGLAVALATQPVFSLETDLVRMRWAEVDDIDFRLVSHAGNSTRTKPNAHYYQEFCCTLGLTPQECLMVGNDAGRDFARPDCGLRTAYVGHGLPGKGVFRGSIRELGDHLPELVAKLNAEDAAGT